MFQEYSFGKSKIRLRLGDISDSSAKVLVSSDDSLLTMRGGVSRSILRKVGPSVKREAQGKADQVQPGDVVVTSAGGSDKWSYIFHGITRSVGNRQPFSQEETERIVSGIICKSINLLQTLGIESIAFPAIGTGFAHHSVRAVAALMARKIREILDSQLRSMLVEIWICPLSLGSDLSFLDFFRRFDEQIGWTNNVVRNHALVMIHGIRTDASSFDLVSRIFRESDHRVYVVNAGYGYFDIIRFLLPLTWVREKAVRKVQRTLKGVCSTESTTHVSIIAHSFGTQICSEVLTRDPGLKIYTLILCGSVMRDDYPWDAHREQLCVLDPRNFPTVRVINDCGWRDVWPVLARSSTWGYGAAGRWGFQSECVEDRFHNADHSDFFSEEFICKYWVPAVSERRIVQATQGRPKAPYWLQVLTTVKLPYLLIVGILAAVVLLGTQ